MSSNATQAQAICGVDVEKLDYYADNKSFSVMTQLCRENSFTNPLYFDWGDGHIDTLPVAAAANNITYNEFN